MCLTTTEQKPVIYLQMNWTQSIFSYFTLKIDVLRHKTNISDGMYPLCFELWPHIKSLIEKERKNEEKKNEKKNNRKNELNIRTSASDWQFKMQFC